MANDDYASADLPVPIIQSLRAEIIEAERSGAELLKWKLIAASAVASLALGLRPQSSPQAVKPADSHIQLIICLVPLICSYVDMVSLDIAVRIQVIGAFLREHEDTYENWVQELRGADRNPFRFAPFAVHGSSLVVSLLVLGIGLVGAGLGWQLVDVVTFAASGVLGVIAVAALQRLYVRYEDYLADQFPGTKRPRRRI